MSEAAANMEIPHGYAGRLADSERLNSSLEAEVETAGMEAFLAREALAECAAQAQRSLQLRESGVYRVKTSESIERVEADAEALAEALVASELALEAVLNERDTLARELSSARRGIHEDARHVEKTNCGLDQPDSNGVAEECRDLKLQLLEAQRDIRRLSSELVSCPRRDENAVVEALESRFAEMSEQRDAEWAARLRASDDEVKRLRLGLNAVWTESEASAGEFASSLLEVQAHMMQMHGSFGAVSPTSGYSAGHSDSVVSVKAGGSPSPTNGFRNWH